MGGAAGHMNHPFDLGWVKTGSDLVKFFNKAKSYLEEKNVSSVKIDGVNVSFKVIDTPSGKQFAVDRGSAAEVDISGITIDRISEKFPEGHGMRIYIAEMLTFLNDAIDAAQPALRKLGLWDDPTKFLNAEYAKEGVTNIIKYDRKLLALHGVNQFYEKIAKSGPNKGNVRNGLDRPLVVNPKTGKERPITDASSEIPYDREALKELVEILQPFGEKYGFYVYGDIPSENTIEIDFSEALSEPFSIKLSEDNIVTKSIEQWLKEADNPGYFPLKRTDGKPSHPFHKELYKTILNQDIPLMDYIIERDPENPVDWDKAVDGIVMLHATRMLGNQVLKTLESELGNLKNHEGVIFRNSEIFGTQKPVKITGDFIVGGTESEFQKVKTLEEEEVEVIPDKKTTAIVPGAFKPPHKGHADMVRKYAEKADEVIVLISNPTKFARKLPNGKEVTAKHSERIWNEVFGPDLPGNVKIQKSPKASPLQAVFDAIGKDGPFNPETDRVILGASDKTDDKTDLPDWHRWIGAEKYAKDGLEVLYGDEHVVNCTERDCGIPFSASTMRDDLLKRLIDDPTDKEAYNDLTEFFPKKRIDVLFSILNLEPPRIDSEEIEETSAAGVGAMAGAPKPIGKRDPRKNESIVTIDEVMRLIMERGILQ